MNAHPALVVVAALLLGAAVRAQAQPPGAQNPQNPQNPALPQDPRQLQGLPQQPMPSSSIYSPLQTLPNTLRSQWAVTRQRQFQGFPVFPSALSQYGTYPGAPRPGADRPLLLPLPPAEPGPPGWPAWVRTRDKQPLPFAADLALLIRNGDRVWVRTVADEPFVPLFFHDKLRTLSAGASIEVRQVGDFDLLLHQSTRVQAHGPTRVELLAMNENEVQFRIGALTWLRLGAAARRHTITLPDASTLTIDAPPPAAPGLFTPPPDPLSAPLPNVTDLIFARADEPGWLGGRATLTNLGTTSVTWRHAGGEVVLAPSHRVTFFLRGEAPAIAAALATKDAVVEPAGSGVVCRAAGPATVSWSGAEFALPEGASVQFDPMQGRPFEPAAPRKNP